MTPNFSRVKPRSNKNGNNQILTTASKFYGPNIIKPIPEICIKQFLPLLSKLKKHTKGTGKKIRNSENFVSANHKKISYSSLNLYFDNTRQKTAHFRA